MARPAPTSINRLVVLISAIVFVDTMFYAVVAPLLPRLADELDLSKVGAGVLTASYPAGTLLGSLPGGILASRIGPKRTVLIGLTLLAGSSLAFGLLHDIVALDIVRFIQGVGGACSWAGGLAWLVAEAPEDRRGEMIGTALGAAIGGALLGPVVGGLAEVTSRELVFGTVVIFAGVLAVAAIATPATHEPVTERLGDLRRAVRHPRIAVGMWLVALPALAFGSIGVLGPLRLDDFGAGGVAIGATFLVAAAVEAIVSPLVGRASDRRGRMVPIRFGLAGAGVLMLTFTLPATAVLFAVTIVLITGTLGAFWAPSMAMLSDAADSVGLSQGLAFALVNLAWATGQVVGSGAGGAIAKSAGDAVPLLIASIMCFATLWLTRRGGESRMVTT